MFRWHCNSIIALLMATTLVAAQGPHELESSKFVKIEVDPPELRLTGPAPFRLLVTGETSEGLRFDLTDRAEYRIANESLANVNAGGVIQPSADGVTSIEIAVGSLQASLPLQLVESRLKRPVHFENDLEPLFTRFQCNASGCHGKAEGQNGFKLSVFGSDPQADFRAIVMEARGRRVFPGAAERSLLLQKASGMVPHGGGVRIAPESTEYAMLHDWIAAGTPRGDSAAPQVTSIEMTPREATMTLESRRKLRITAAWSDGRKQDVTHWARFQSNQEGIASVDELGYVTAGKTPGTAAIMASFMGRVAVFQAFIPRAEPLADSSPPPQFNFIDTAVDKRLKQLRIRPSEICTDAEFLRRASLDFLGTLPTPTETRTFLADTRDDRYARLIDSLLARPEFVDYWSLKFADLLRVDRQALGHKGAYAQYRWIRESLRANVPLDRFASAVITAEGPFAEVPQGLLFKSLPDPGKAASAVSQVFLGVRIECAECHHHPYDRWSQSDYLGMTAFFTPLQRKNSQFGEWLAAVGDPVTKHPRTGEIITAHALGTTMPEKNSSGDRRPALAEWMRSPENPFFAQNWANRIWAHFLGRGLVEPVDDFRSTNPPSNAELLAALARELRENKFDMRAFMKTIALSRTYRQSSHPNETNVRDEQNYSRDLLKRLDAEVLLDAISHTTGIPEKFEGTPPGTRAIALWDSQIDHSFLRMFGRPVRQTTCECERVSEPSVAQVLHLLNGERLNEKLSRSDGRVHKLVTQIGDDRALVDELYLLTFNRFPESSERSAAVAHLEIASRKGPTERRQAAEDLMWTMLNSLEFVFNH